MSQIDMDQFISDNFGCDRDKFYEALSSSPNARGYIIGALSEVILQHHLETIGYDVLRIVEKPAGGYNAKSDEARGDFYVRRKGSKADTWLVVESKGLKSNSEFRGAKFDCVEKVYRFLRPLVFPATDAKSKTYSKGQIAYNKAKAVWGKTHPGGRFPPFSWNRETPGPITCDLTGIWEDENALREYLESLPGESFSEVAYRQCRGALSVLETHKPSRREGPITGIEQAAPLVSDFSILSVDLYLRTGKHEFAFANPKNLSHSPTSPEHLYQNYTIDILIRGIKERPNLMPPWYSDFEECLEKTNPDYRQLDKSQIDNR